MINSHSFNVMRDFADRSRLIISTSTTDVGGAGSSTSVATINITTPDISMLDFYYVL